MDSAKLRKMVSCISQVGVSFRQAEDSAKRMGEAVAELREILLRSWKRDCGMLRFFSVEWWQLFLNR